MTIPAALQQSLADRYRVERELGRGGMAAVYLADDLKHGRRVAIKVMQPELVAAIGLDRFLREIEIAARLSHPHILPLFDSGAADGQPYYVTPYVAGESLRTRLDRERQLPLEDALRLGHEIASALGHAHRQGIVHRDIKPENILLADGVALVADFGIARAAAPSGAPADSDATVAAMTTAGVAIGTPRYMAPEQASGGDVDGRADLYALACVLYEMLAGQPPFTAPTSDALMRMHASATATPVTTLRPNVPPAVAAAIAKGLEKIPADRHATAAQFAEALTAGLGAAATPPSPAPGNARPHNLPRQRTHFIGRERELAECAKLLRDSRLLTLTGVGGCGKTRLAIQLGADVVEGFPGGVWFVDFAPVPEQDRVALTVAETLGVIPDPGTPVLRTLIEHLAPKKLLLVLDNCEHLVSACAALIDRVLAEAEDVRILATSREGFGVEGERLFAVRSLSVPERERERDVAAVAASESARLFVDRALLVDGRFALNDATAPAVAEICRRLDGIPLAIELAAARVKVLSVDEIRARLDDRFRLLTGGSKTSLPRHQTLRATVAWSYDQLTEEEQRLLRLLAVFVGGWTLSAAVAVRGEDADEFEVLECLGRLVDKSLVSVRRLPDQSSRYGMLETVRQFAQELLDESGAGPAARGRHLDYFIAFAQGADIHGPEGGTWRARLDQEQENLLAAHRWCDSDPDGGEKGLRLITAESSYWGDRGFIELGLRLAEAALERPGAAQRTRERAAALFRAGHLRHHLMDLDAAVAYGEEMRSLCAQIDDKVRMVVALCHLSWTLQAKPDWPTALQYAEEALAVADASGHADARNRARSCLVSITIATKEYGRALTLTEESIAFARSGGSLDGLALGLAAQAQIFIDTGRTDETWAPLRESLDVAQSLGPRLVQLTMDVVAAAAAAVGEPERAARYYGFSEATRERMRLHREPVDAQFLKPWIERARGARGDGPFDADVAAGRGLPYEAGVSEALGWLESRRAG